MHNGLTLYSESHNFMLIVINLSLKIKTTV